MIPGDEVDGSDVSVSTVLSRIPLQSSLLPEELIPMLLTPLITPYKESRDHHLIITSHQISPTAQLIREVSSINPFYCLILMNVVDFRCPWSQNNAYVRIRVNVVTRPP